MRYAPWHEPRWRDLGGGVEVYTVYGSHVLAALLHAAFRFVARRPETTEER